MAGVGRRSISQEHSGHNRRSGRYRQREQAPRQGEPLRGPKRHGLGWRARMTHGFDSPRCVSGTSCKVAF